MEPYVGMPCEVLVNAVSDQMSFGTTVRQKVGKGVIALIHPSGFYKISGNQQEGDLFRKKFSGQRKTNRAGSLERTGR